MKTLDIALLDLVRSFRSFFAIVFMFVVPLLVTGLFYFMFGNIADSGGFELPRTKAIIADMDEGGPKFNINPKNIPGGKEADTMGELIVGILESDEMADLIEVYHADTPEAARTAVDTQASQVAIIIPADFSRKFADVDEEAAIEFYQDPTLTIGPGIIRAIMDRFTEGMAGVKIAVNVFLDEAPQEDQAKAGEVVQRYLKISLAEADDIEEELLDVRVPAGETDASEQSSNVLLNIVSPIMGGMMIFYAFFTGSSTAQSILKEEEQHTLPRLFTTPTSQSTILSGKFMAVFLTVSVQVAVLLTAAWAIYGIQWGDPLPMALVVIGTVCSASAFGIFLISFMRTTKLAGSIFGGVLTVTGMVGMIRIFAMGSPSAARLGDTVSLLVPQGWAIRGLLQAMDGEALSSIFVTTLVVLGWSAVMFGVGVWRFNKRYA